MITNCMMSGGGGRHGGVTALPPPLSAVFPGLTTQMLSSKALVGSHIEPAEAGQTEVNRGRGFTAG